MEGSVGQSVDRTVDSWKDGHTLGAARCDGRRGLGKDGARSSETGLPDKRGDSCSASS